MTRFGIDARVAIRIAEGGLVVAPEHQLVAPAVLRTHALELLYRGVRAGERTERDGLAVLGRIAELRIRVLGDRYSRATAWRIAAEHGWEDPVPAEYLAVTRLQADALVALDPALRRAAQGVVPLAGIEDLRV